MYTTWATVPRGNSAEVGAKYIVQAVQEQIKKAKEQ